MRSAAVLKSLAVGFQLEALPHELVLAHCLDPPKLDELLLREWKQA